MNTLLRDLGYVIRKLARARLFAAATVATLAIAIGANSAVFSVVNGVLLEPLPFEAPDRLVSLGYTAPGLDFERVNHAPALHFTYLDEGRSFENVGMWWSTSASVAGREAPEDVQAILVTHTTLPLLGIPRLAVSSPSRTTLGIRPSPSCSGTATGRRGSVATRTSSARR